MPKSNIFVSIERRLDMNKHFTPAISEEKFAAWLDGMLPNEEMNRIDLLVESDSMLHQLRETNALVDAAISNFNDADIQKLPEIDASAFELPAVSKNCISQLVNLSPDPTDDLLIAACANDDVMFVDNNLSADELTKNTQQESNLEGEQFDGASDLSNIINDEI